MTRQKGPHLQRPRRRDQAAQSLGTGGCGAAGWEQGRWERRNREAGGPRCGRTSILTPRASRAREGFRQVNTGLDVDHGPQVYKMGVRGLVRRFVQVQGTSEV